MHLCGYAVRITDPSHNIIKFMRLQSVRYNKCFMFRQEHVVGR